MKKTISVLCFVLFIFIALLPLGTALFSWLGYTFEVFSVPAFAIALAALSACIVVLDVIHKDAIKNKAVCVLMAMAMPLTLFNVVYYVLKSGHILVFISTVICAGCCFYLGIKHGKPVAVKIVVLVLSGLMVLPVGFLGVMAFLFGNIGQNTVVQTVESPGGKYYAQVIDSDQGALGGDTLVNVYENSGIDLFLFKIEKKPRRVYFGEWGEFRDMEIYWKNDNCIVINSAEYEIK